MTTYKRIRRAYASICSNCLGSGFLATKHGPVRCRECNGTGAVKKWLNEIVTEDKVSE